MMEQKQLHLDSEYRNRYEIYHTPNKIYDSRECNWRNVPWDEVTKIQVKLRYTEFELDKPETDTFKGFIRWRNHIVQGRIRMTKDNVIDEQTFSKNKKEEWCIGWTDGENCFMTIFDFKTGELLGKEIIPLDQHRGSIHSSLNI